MELSELTISFSQIKVINMNLFSAIELGSSVFITIQLEACNQDYTGLLFLGSEQFIKFSLFFFVKYFLEELILWIELFITEVGD